MRVLLLGLCLCEIASCTSTTSVPVSRREAREAVHVVKSGETLYKIAWQYRIDQQELASWNGIRNPDELRVGQRLRLVPPRGYVAAAPAPTSRSPDTPTQSTATRATTTQRPSTSTPARTPSTRPAPKAPAPAAAALRWSWPTEGQVVARFGADGTIGSGIGIGGREGQPVRAAAAGKVVYAGGGLIGYGQLVIIKHDETFLSAYGYNSELLVTQGQDVARGATIALMGLGGPGRQPRLHFEIRRNGVPVDPLLFVTAPH
ncbi:MAG TPA: peptidoglycan DD-metalloendopeptidase family protein [Gammaproteobacteria bacterium]